GREGISDRSKLFPTRFNSLAAIMPLDGRPPDSILLALAALPPESAATFFKTCLTEQAIAERNYRGL
ncbi:MAG: hypothetical protein VW842_00710, partial [Halieaceae bacterium]